MQLLLLQFAIGHSNHKSNEKPDSYYNLRTKTYLQADFPQGS